LEKGVSEFASRSRNGSPLLHLVADLVLTTLAWYLAAILRPILPFGKPLGANYDYSPFLYLLIPLVWMVVFLLLSVYTARPRRAIDEGQALFAAVTLATLTLAGVLYFSDRGISRLQVITFYVLDLVLLIGYRLILQVGPRVMKRPRRARRRVLILGAGEAGLDVLEVVARREWAELEPVGFLDDGVPAGSIVAGCPVLGRVEDVARHIEAERVDEVVVALPQYGYDQFFSLMGQLRALPVRVRIVPDHVKLTLFRTRVEDFADVSMITLRRPSLSAFERQVKRAFDLVLGAIGLVVSLPLMILIAIAIRLDSPGPVIYRQRRVGEKGRIFKMYKFRSMVADADEQLDQMIYHTEDGRMLFKHPDDPRVTRVGRFLRRFSLDELPQTLNVLKGEMSLVGPRPELPWIVEQYEPWQWRRFAVPQGVTGWWQVNGRSDKPMHLHTEEDLYYIQNYSLMLDFQILWDTVGAVLKGRGAF